MTGEEITRICNFFRDQIHRDTQLLNEVVDEMEGVLRAQAENTNQLVNRMRRLGAGEPISEQRPDQFRREPVRTDRLREALTNATKGLRDQEEPPPVPRSQRY